MFDQIQAIFPHSILLTPQMNVEWNRYQWYKTPHSEIIGVPKENMTDNEKELLQTFLEPYTVQQPVLTAKEQRWREWIFHHKEAQHEYFPRAFRFIYFSLSNQDIEPDVFHEAIQGLFPHTMPILWENQHEGIIVEEQVEQEKEQIEYDQMIDVLMSDFYTKLLLYITPYYESPQAIQHAYSFGYTCFKMMLHYRPNSVTTYQDAMTYMYIDSMQKKEADEIINTVLGPVRHDSNLIQTIQVFLESNSNTTLAAKKLYMHRNSLQYRVDKFIEKTGIDVKQFQGALITYLAIMNLHHQD